MEYEVLLAAIYSNEVESDEMVLVESTGKLNVSTNGTCCLRVRFGALPALLTVVFITESISNLS